MVLREAFKCEKARVNVKSSSVIGNRVMMGGMNSVAEEGLLLAEREAGCGRGEG